MKNLKYWLSGIRSYGLIFIIAHILPVYFRQDVKNENFGRDYITYKKTNSYHRSRIQNNPYWFRYVD